MGKLWIVIQKKIRDTSPNIDVQLNVAALTEQHTDTLHATLHWYRDNSWKWAETGSIQFNSIQFYLYSTNS